MRSIVRKLKIELPNDVASNDNSNEPTRVANQSNVLINLIQKHVPSSNGSQTLETELLKFNEMRSNENCLLTFWKKNCNQYPKLAIIARSLLAWPLTTAKSEGSFSVTGSLIRSQRAVIEPYRVEKVLFIHDNYDLLNLN